MHKKFSSAIVVAFLFIISAMLLAGGCGGSSSSPINNNGGQNPNAGFTLGGNTILNGIDADDNGKPDFLDFTGVAQVHMKASQHSLSTPLNAPVMVWFESLMRSSSATESADVFTVNLSAGTEYTFEFSRNLVTPLGNFLPDIEIIDPSGEILPLYQSENLDTDSGLESGVIDACQLSVYPLRDPVFICLTFTPSTSGLYTVRLCRLDTSFIANLSADVYTYGASDDVYGEDTTNLTEDEYFAQFIESLGEDSKDVIAYYGGDTSSATLSGISADDDSCVLFIYEEMRGNDKAGYYTQFRSIDGSDDISGIAERDDIAYLRQLFIDEVDYDYMSRVYGPYLTDDPSGEGADISWAMEVADVEDLLRMLGYIDAMQGIFTIDSDNSYWEDAEFSASAPTSTPKKTSRRSPYTKIEPSVSGVPYESKYMLGRGFFGITGIQAANTAISSFKLPVPQKKSSTSNYTMKFASSYEEVKDISTTTVGGGLSVAGFGLGASYSKSKNFSSGLNSTTFVIHYEETENDPRRLNDNQYTLTQAAKTRLASGYNNFRNAYGDYFVAGYLYGGTFDAYIQITTKTSAQIDTIKTSLSGVKSSDKAEDFKANINFARELQNTLKKNNASISIEIRTSGINAANPNAKSITPKHGKNSLSSISDVFAEMMKFRTKLAAQKPADYPPIGIVLNRYKTIEAVSKQMEKDKAIDGVPFAPAHSVKISELKDAIDELHGYYNVIDAANRRGDIDRTVYNNYKRQYNNTLNTMNYDPDFFSDTQKVPAAIVTVTNLSKTLKALGDRYNFYEMLVESQKNEDNMFDRYDRGQDDASDADTAYQPFGGHKGGSTGYNSYKISTAVTEDIEAGKNEVELNGRQAFLFMARRYWGTSNHNMNSNTVDPSYTAYTNNGNRNAIFCYVRVRGDNDTDRHRRFTNRPIVGKNRMDFDFTSGWSENARWTVWYSTMHFPREKYPFRGLRD